MDVALGALVADCWSSLIAEHGLGVEADAGSAVTLRSAAVHITVTLGRGELSVSVVPLGGSATDGWRYDGMVGKATEARLLELAAERLIEDPRVLQGDATLFAQIADERRRLSAEWTAHYAGQGPRPRTGPLP